MNKVLESHVSNEALGMLATQRTKEIYAMWSMVHNAGATAQMCLVCCTFQRWLCVLHVVSCTFDLLTVYRVRTCVAVAVCVAPVSEDNGEEPACDGQAQEAMQAMHRATVGPVHVGAGTRPQLTWHPQHSTQSAPT